MQKSILSSILLLGAVCAQANNYTVTSPNGKLVMNVKCEGGKASYTVDLNGKQMLAASALCFIADISSADTLIFIKLSLFINLLSISDFVPTKSMLAKINPISPELNTLAILSG